MFGVGALGYVARAIRNYFVGSSLDLRFTGADQTLDPRVTFTRTSNATVTDSTGTLVYAPHNLLTFSESFDNAVWVKLGSTVAANITVAPDGLTTADKIVENSADSEHNVFVSAFTATGFNHTASFYVKAAGRTKVVLRTNSATGSFVNVGFDLLTAAVTRTPSGYSAEIISVGNGWFRCSFTAMTTIEAYRVYTQ